MKSLVPSHVAQILEQILLGDRVTSERSATSWAIDQLGIFNQRSARRTVSLHHTLTNQYLR